MADKRFGVTQAPGVAVIEKDPLPAIVSAQLGVSVLIGAFERGTVGKLVKTVSLNDFRSRMGGLISELDTVPANAGFSPDAAFGYYSEAEGSGELHCVRVTDGLEKKSQLSIFSRDTTPEDVVLVEGKNGGRWGGKKQDFTIHTTDFTGVTETVVTITDLALSVNRTIGGKVVTYVARQIEVDELIGATLKFDTSTIFYKVVSNSAISSGGGGTITVDSGSTMVADGVVVTDTILVALASGSLGLSVKAKDGEVDPANEFGLEIFVDGNLVLDYKDLSMDSTSVRYFLNLINDDANNFYVTVTDVRTNALTVDSRPANAYAPATGVADITLTDSTAAFVVNEFAGGFLYPDQTNVADNAKRFRIVSNTATVITVEVGSDLTGVNDGTDKYRVEYADELEGGYDGLGVLDDVHYQNHLTLATSVINTLASTKKGLVKIAIPGVSNFTLIAADQVQTQKDAITYVIDKNYMYIVEIPSATVTREAAQDFINTTIGRDKLVVTHFPSWGKITNPDSLSNKTIPLSGDILGEEARIANDFDGYHKAAAGLEAVLGRVVELLVELTPEDMEFLNPKGLNAVIRKGSVFVLWGDRTLSTDLSWVFKHKREQMSHYEHVLLEDMNLLIFPINDKKTRNVARGVLRDFFRKEWQPKRALKGDSFAEAAQIKLDDEINTPATEALGELHAEIKLRLADTVEKFVIKIGQKGIFEDVLSS